MQIFSDCKMNNTYIYLNYITDIHSKSYKYSYST
jgi:hypothetical protein